MKLLGWNVNHRARKKAIPLTMAEALAFLEPDLIDAQYVWEAGPCKFGGGES